MKPPDPSPLPRLSFAHLLENILEQLNLERGIGYTIKKLIADPHGAIREYLFFDRRRMVKPITLMLLTVAVATFISLNLLPGGTEFGELLEKDPGMAVLPPSLRKVVFVFSDLMQQYFNIVFMSSLPFTALATFVVFKEKGLNYVEHLLINIYLFCIQNIVVIVLLPPVARWRLDWLGAVMGFLIMGYYVYAYTKVFEQKWLPGFLNTLLVFIVYQFFYGITLMITALIIVWFF